MLLRGLLAPSSAAVATSLLLPEKRHVFLGVHGKFALKSGIKKKTGAKFERARPTKVNAMEILYLLTTVFVFLISIGLLVLVSCWQDRPGRLAFIMGFGTQTITSLYFVAYQLILGFFYNLGNSGFQILQYTSAIFTILNLFAMLFILFGFISLTTEFSRNKNKTFGGSSDGAPSATPVILPHRSGLLLGLGILGVFLWPVAPVVRHFASKDLAAMNKSEMDPTGLQGAKVAYVLGAIGTLLLVGVLFSAIFMFVVLYFGLV